MGFVVILRISEDNNKQLRRLNQLFLENEMAKRILAALGIALITTGAWAQCTSHTIWNGGRMIMCTTCCYGSNCNTNCF